MRKLFRKRKLLGTFKICFILFMARTFGHYNHSGWNGVFEYASYNWRGKTYHIPLGPIDKDGMY